MAHLLKHAQWYQPLIISLSHLCQRSIPSIIIPHPLTWHFYDAHAIKSIIFFVHRCNASTVVPFSDQDPHQRTLCRGHDMQLRRNRKFCFFLLNYIINIVICIKYFAPSCRITCQLLQWLSCFLDNNKCLTMMCVFFSTRSQFENNLNNHLSSKIRFVL